MRRRLPRSRRLRRPRRLSDGDPTTNPVPGSEELEGWDSDFEEWMTGSPGANTPPGGA